MTLKHNVDITVHSVIDNLTEEGLPYGEPEINIFTAPGFMNTEEGHTSVSYSENTEGGAVFCDIDIYASGKAKITRRGAVECNISLAEGQIYTTLYRVPPYSFDMTVRAKKVRSSLAGNGGELRLIYSMNIGGQEKNVNMKITVRIK